MQQVGDLALSLLDHGCHPLALELHAIDAEKKKKKNLALIMVPEVNSVYHLFLLFSLVLLKINKRNLN